MPETRYARSGDVNIAYQVVGDGRDAAPVDTGCRQAQAHPYALVQPLVSVIADTGRLPAIIIHSSKDEPAFQYRIQHRGYWFYVDDTELESKMFLEALVAAYSSRVGSKQAGDEKPQVVLPVGG